MDDPYGPIARFYDRVTRDYPDDLSLYEALAGRFGGPVLEIGAGTGRLAVPLAAAGFDVVALETSAAMAAIGRERARAAGVAVRWVAGRIEEYAERAEGDGERFGLVICAVDTFLHLTSEEAQAAALRAAGRLLAPGGRLVLDLPTLAAWPDWEPGVRALDLVWSEAREGGGTLSFYSTFQAEPAAQVRRVTHVFEETDPDGGVRRWLASFDLRFVGRFEAALLLERAGMLLEGAYGDYELGPLAAESARMILIAGRRDEEG